MTKKKQVPTTLEMDITASKFVDNWNNPAAKYDCENVYFASKTFKNPDPTKLGEYIIKQCKKGELVTIEIEGVWLDEEGIQI